MFFASIKKCDIWLPRAMFLRHKKIVDSTKTKKSGHGGSAYGSHGLREMHWRNGNNSCLMQLFLCGYAGKNTAQENDSPVPPPGTITNLWRSERATRNRGHTAAYTAVRHAPLLEALPTTTQKPEQYLLQHYSSTLTAAENTPKHCGKQYTDKWGPFEGLRAGKKQKKLKPQH